MGEDGIAARFDGYEHFLPVLAELCGGRHRMDAGNARCPIEVSLLANYRPVLYMRCDGSVLTGC